MLRRILLTAVLTVIVAVGGFAYLAIKLDVGRQVQVSLLENSGRCNANDLLVTITNNSWETIPKVSWRIWGTEEGHSTVLASQSYDSDKIMKAGETQELCVFRPQQNDEPINPYRDHPDTKWHFDVVRHWLDATE